ncbi:hypothetical protein PF003_g963 [Phytophthora fragariae]|nr:hypothetical protein PF003_g963 [Phytophthora fragariae]
MRCEIDWSATSREAVEARNELVPRTSLAVNVIQGDDDHLVTSPGVAEKGFHAGVTPAWLLEQVNVVHEGYGR